MTLCSSEMWSHVTVWKFYISIIKRVMARNPGKLLTYESRFSNQMLKPSPSYYFISCFLNLSIYHFLFIITFINCLNLLNSSLAFIFFFSFLFQSFFWFFFRENIKKDSNICFLQQLIHDIPSFLPSFRKKKRLKY